MKLLLTGVLVVSVGLCACGGGGTTSTPSAQPQITVTPATPQVRVGSTQQFAAQVSNTTGTLTWAVNGTTGGSAAAGTIDANGLYTTPTSLPTPNTVTISASLSSNSSVTGNTVATLLNPMPAIATATVTSITPADFVINITGSGFVSGTKLMLGSTAIPVSVDSATSLTGQALGVAAGTAFSLQASNPDPGAATSNTVTVAAANVKTANVTANSRLLDQASWGPTIADIAHVQSVGLQGWLTEQFAAPQTQIPQPPQTLPTYCNTTVACVQQSFFQNALGSSDQLRQRVAFALSQIFVISAVEIPRGDAMASYFNMLAKDAFGNYLTIMKDVTLSGGMGTYLNMVNSDKPNTTIGQIANENYARELMQLFSLGTALLNPDGTPQLDANSNTIQPYTEPQVQAFAKAFTGWTYARSDGTTPSFPNNTQFFGAPMVPIDAHHDTSAKAVLNNITLPPGQTTQQDLDQALANIFNHTNVGPFVARQLILHLVSSNPSPAYISRVATVFNDNGSGVRGDMKAVIQAIFMDPEARRGDSSTTAQPGDGHLREPVLYITNLLRGLSVQASDPNAFASSLQGFGNNMSQRVMYSPSVFNYFSPDYVIPGTTLFGPEFQLLTTATTVVRQNFVDSVVRNALAGGVQIDLTRFANIADPQQLVDTLDAIFTHGALPSTDKSAIVTAVNAVPASNPQQRARVAVYLVTSSSQYQVMQ